MKRPIIAAAAIAAFLIVGSNLPPSTYRAAALLKLDALPESAQHVECWSRGWEDDFTQCVGIAAIEDVPALISGWPFETAAKCARIPNEAHDAPTHCYHYSRNEPREGGYVTFSFAEGTGWFYATIFTP